MLLYACCINLHRYVSNDSTYVINIDSKSRTLARKLFNGKDFEKKYSILQTFDECNNKEKIAMEEMDAMRQLFHIYDTAFVSVWKLLSIDSYTRFKTTDEYLDLLKKLDPDQD